MRSPFGVSYVLNEYTRLIDRPNRAIITRKTNLYEEDDNDHSCQQ